MNVKTRDALLSRGFPTDLIAKIAENFHTVSSLEVMSKAELSKTYSQAEIAMVCDLVKRKPISDEVLKKVVSSVDQSCCYCCDGNSSRPYQIHHITPYCETQDNSEDNLLLVCPTHHEVVPKTDSEQLQKQQRRKWQAIVQIARDFRKQGIPFPYDRLVAYDYEHAFDPAEIIHSYRISPSLCMALSDHKVATECIDELKKNHFALIVGNSGSGKSTLAVGVAGHFAKSHDSRVFQYRFSGSYSTSELPEILRCISCSANMDVLILDDANKFLTIDDLVTVSRAVRSKSMRVIATWTNEADNGEVVQRHLPQWLLVNWERLRNPIFTFMKLHETIIAPAIQSFRSRDDHEKIGLGAWDIPLSRYLDRQDKDIRTASQFFYLLRGGKQTIAKELSSLASNDRSDIPVIFAAIEQIAGFEKAVSVKEVCSACERDLLGSADPNWVEAVFEQQCRNGKMKKQLGMYTTIHRDFAMRIVSSAMSNVVTRDAVINFLLRDFDLTSADPMRFVILTSWFWYDDSVGPWIRAWAYKQNILAWETLVEKICKSDLSIMGLSLEWLGMYCMERCLSREAVADLLKKNEKAVAEIISTATESSWHDLRRVAQMMQTELCPVDLITPTLGAEKCASMLEKSSPVYYDSANWFFSSMEKLRPEWVRAVGSQISAELMSEQFGLASRGDLEVFFNFFSLIGRLKLPLKRSITKRVSAALHQKLIGASVADLRLGFGDSFILELLFPDDCRYILSAIDLVAWAREIEQSNPREWREIVFLHRLDAQVQVLKNIHKEIDPEKLLLNIKEKYRGNEYEMRCFLWFLGLARPKLRARYLAQLLDVIRDSFARIESERSFLFVAVSRFDRSVAEKLADEFKYTPTVDDRKKTPTQWASAELTSIQQRLRQLDKLDRDYFIHTDRIVSDSSSEPFWELI